MNNGGLEPPVYILQGLLSCMNMENVHIFRKFECRERIYRTEYLYFGEIICPMDTSLRVGTNLNQPMMKNESDAEKSSNDFKRPCQCEAGTYFSPEGRGPGMRVLAPHILPPKG